MGKTVRIGLLLIASASLAALLEMIGLPAGQLLGPMLAALAFAWRGDGVTLPPLLFVAAQAVIGLLIAPNLNVGVLATAAHQPGLFVATTFSTLFASVLIGWLLARWRVLPGSVAIWGSMPGAATAMVLMARDAGEDWRLVAVMGYLRVICVALLASALAAILGGHFRLVAAHRSFFPPLDALGLTESLGIGVFGAWGGLRLGVPAGGMLGPAVLGAALGATGAIQPQLPPWILASAYLLVGWRIGFGFTPEVFATIRAGASRLLAATIALIFFCAGCGLVIARVAAKDLMTGYLAASPGGADSIAIIANATPVDVPFVVAMQVMRFAIVLMIGPFLARYVAGCFERKHIDGQVDHHQPP